MQQFVIPQFIDEEAHILGPIAVRQFVIMLVAGFFIFISYRLADFTLFVVLTILIGGGAGFLAFAKVNGRPFHFFLLNLLQTLQRPALRVWRKEVSSRDVKDSLSEEEEPSVAPAVVREAHLAHSRLSDLALVVDTGGVYRGQADSSTKS